MDKQQFEKDIAKINKQLIEFETQVNIYRAFDSEVQSDYCSKLQFEMWNNIYDLKMSRLSEDQEEMLEELSEALEAICSKYYQIFLGYTEKLIEQIKERQEVSSKVEDILGK